jgi:flagellar protein FliL
MPNDRDRTDEEPSPDVEESVGAEGGGVLSALKMLLPIVLISLGGGGYLAYSQYASLAEAAASAGIHVGLGERPDEEAPVEYGEFGTIDDLLINPAGSGGNRFLVVSLGVEAQQHAVLEELLAKEIVVRDAVLRLLSRRTAEELGSIELRDQIKNELLVELNAVLQDGEIDRLYFTQYLIQ